MSERRTLAFAYACEPGKGSEPGAGWTWARILASLGDVWVVTRANNREAIEAELPALPERERLHFVYVDLPPWARWWKRGERGVRAYYLLWQAAAVLRARRLRPEDGFDLVWHVTLANAWLGSLGPLVPGRFVYGPVGAGMGAPWPFLKDFGARAIAYELRRSLIRTAGRYLNPVARLAWNRADLILVQNPETLRWLPRRHRDKARVFPHVAVERLPDPLPRAPGQPTAIFAGRLLMWKGSGLAIRAMAHLPGWRLLVCGKGPNEPTLRRLASSLGVSDRVAFLGWVRPDELHRMMWSEADVFLFPSLHEEGSFAVGDALACGLPVVCVDRGGPPVVAGRAGVPVPSTGGPDGVARALAQVLQDRGRLPSREAARRRAVELTPERLGERLRALVAHRFASPAVVDTAGVEVGAAE